VTWLSPPAIAERLGIDAHKVLGWIGRGELKAVNVADHVGGRPRWRIAERDLEAFIARRSSKTEPTKTRRRKTTKPADFVEYF